MFNELENKMSITWNEWRNETKVSNDLKELEGETIASVSGGNIGDYIEKGFINE